MQADASETAGIKGAHRPIEHKSGDRSPLDQRARLGAMEFATFNDDVAELRRHQPKKRTALYGVRQPRLPPRVMDRTFNEGDCGHGACMTDAGLIFINVG